MWTDSAFLDRKREGDLLDTPWTRALQALSEEKDLIPEGAVCYLHGMGAQVKSTYASLPPSADYELQWYDSVLTGWWRPLRHVMASYEGLIKIKASKSILPLFEKVVENSMAGLFIFSAADEGDFVQAVTKDRDASRADAIVKRSDHFLCYYIDADNEESDTGRYEILSYGINCKASIKNIWS